MTTIPQAQTQEKASIQDSIELIPIMMTVPNAKCIYCPSKIRKPMTITFAQFVFKYADSARSVRVALSGDIKDAERMTAYSAGMDCWYIL